MKIVIIIIGLIVAAFFVPTVLLNDTGGISGLIKVIGIGGALLTFIRPKIGIYLITMETCYADFFKKLATYYGIPSQLTVIEILSMSMLTIGALWTSIIVFVPLSKYKIQKPQVLLFVGILLYALLISVSGSGGGVKMIQDITNGAGILGIALAITIFYEEPEVQIIKYARHLIFILTPWPILGLWQYYVDYSLVDYWYARTTLSVTNTPLEYIAMRYGFNSPIGFGSSQLHFGFVGFFYALCFWHAITFKKLRALFIFLFLVSLVAIFHTDGRTSMLTPMVVLIIYYLFKSKKLFWSTILAGSTVLLLVIAYSQYIMDNLGDINAYVADMMFFIEDKRRVTLLTLGARLEPLTQFCDLGNWSLIGIASFEEVSKSKWGDRFYSHNAITSLFFTTGISGMLLLAVVGLILLKALSRLIFMATDPLMNKMVRIGAACLLVTLFMRLFLGGNYATQPNNIISMLPVGILVCAIIGQRKITYKKRQQSREDAFIQEVESLVEER